MELLKRKSRDMYDWFGGLFVTKARHHSTITDLSGGAGSIIEYDPNSDTHYQHLMAQQQQAAYNQHRENQLRAQQQMGAATAGMAGLLGQLQHRPQPPTPAPFPPQPVEEPKPAEVPVEEPEFEEVIKEDGTTVLRLKK